MHNHICVVNHGMSVCIIMCVMWLYLSAAGSAYLQLSYAHFWQSMRAAAVSVMVWSILFDKVIQAEYQAKYAGSAM